MSKQFAVKGGHFLSEDPAYFDAPFFSATRSEVLALDPQQRVIMENVYQALENCKFIVIDMEGYYSDYMQPGFL